MSEWLSTNGLGSYASGTLEDRVTRRYHGLFVPALAPPLGRRVLLDKFDASADYAGTHEDLSSNQWRDGTVSPQGERFIVDARAEGGVWITTYAVADASIERRVWMEYGAQQTNIRWTFLAGSAPLDLHLKAFVSDRDYHALGHAFDAGDAVQIDGDRARIALRGGMPWHLHAAGARFEFLGQWYYGLRYALESERGLDDIGDVYAALIVHLHFDRAGESALVTASLESSPLEPADRRQRDRDVLDRRRAAHPNLAHAPEWIERLTLAADAFIVRRGTGSTVIAGYHWFGDWGRDTMIALPGLALTTGRAEIAREILGTFAQTIDQGMLPNRFPDDGAAPEYNTVDAALWFIEAVRLYHAATRDREFVASTFDALDGIIEWYMRGTRYGIAVDPNDGLLRAGEPGVQLTWMDAKVGDWVVTPRIGKPIEVNALWYSALCTMDGFAQMLGKSAYRYRDAGSAARASFQRFWNDSNDYAYDVLDGPEGNDPTIRPNAVFAVALPFRAFDSRREHAIVDRAARELWTPMGLRSMSAREAGYCGTYRGSPQERDAAYHRGTVWPYLAGTFARAYANAYNDRAGARRFIEAVSHRLDDYGIGTLAEIADGDPPHTARGCIAQAWSVAEILRTWHALQENDV